MSIDEIRKNAPEGATHYKMVLKSCTYLSKTGFNKYKIWRKSCNKWTQEKIIESRIKPL